jgi:hypothetical protein
MRKVISLFALLACFSVAVLLADNGQAPVGPIVVAKRSFTNQVGPISQTALFVPTRGGLFRVSCYLDTAAQPPTGNDSVVLSWSDDFNPQLQGFPELSGGSGGVAFSQGSILIRAKAGVPIAINGQGTTATNPYNAYLIVERL